MERAVLVTGAAKRIGRAIALALAGEGYAVAVHYGRSREAADALVAETEAMGGRACAVQGDLADARDVARLVPEAASRLGLPLTMLVNNASQFEPDDLIDLDPAQWERHFAINLRAPAFLVRDFARQCPEGVDGLVVNLLDQRVWKPTPHFFSYQLTKSALWTATQTMAQALAPRGIRVNAIGPGPTISNTRQGDADFRKQTEATPLKRGATPEEIAKSVVFLAATPAMTGQMLALDGGQHLAWETPDVVGIRE
ncbi:SDR family oxidoreductase [Saliniramus sp.]|uniref:SDR family oxidoreductase n=1 Tax=Saliniramus sp. TaxID=2986772 RepID=UPI002CE8381F|nr:SDR family oxidoreductase [Saliniramus sp.]HMB11704.1 SDR family oxidoreductase [Saliniramus sp.]